MRHSLQFPTLRLASSPTGRARLRSHRARWFANLAKYNVARWPFTARARKTLFDSKTKQAPQMWGLFRFGIRQCPTLPGVRPWLLCVHWTPPWPHLAKYNVARWPFTARARRATSGDTKGKHPTLWGVFLLWNPAVSYSPGPSPAKYHRR